MNRNEFHELILQLQSRNVQNMSSLLLNHKFSLSTPNYFRNFLFEHSYYIIKKNVSALKPQTSVTSIIIDV